MYEKPWLLEGRAAPSGSGSKGLLGIVAGGITGAIEIIITYPTEYVKTQLQLDEKDENKKYDGNIDCIRKTIQQYGCCGLYRGLSVLIYGSIPKTAVRFGAFELYKGFLVREDDTLSLGNRVLCGLGAGITEAIVAVTPMETIKVKFIDDRRSDEPRFKGFCHGVYMIIKEEGISGIYKGLIATILKQGSNQAIRFFIMETAKDLYRGEDKSLTIPKWLTAIFGFIAGAASVFGNNPMDVIKTRMQGLEASKYKNTLDCAWKILRNEGICAFYKGTISRLARVSLNVAITFTVYDSIMELFDLIIALNQGE